MVCVIGEISNRSEPSRKFVQTFVLAEQPNGYYVLNDVFRYLIDEEEEIVADEAGTIEPTHTQEEAPAEAPKEAEAEATKPAAEAQVNNETAAHEVNEKLEEAATNGETEKAPEAAAPAPAPAAEPMQPAEATPAAPEVVQEEQPKSPAPTPVAAPTKAAPEKENVAPAKAVPALPKTWANIASKPGAAVATPVIPVAPPKPATASAPQQPQQQPQQQQQQPAATPSAPASEKGVSQPSSNDGAGWQTAGADHGKRQSRAGEEQNVLAYIKNVTEKIDAGLLKQTLSRFGKIKYFDVSRQKVCSLDSVICRPEKRLTFIAELCLR